MAVDKNEASVTPIQRLFYWWGRLSAHKSPKGSFPARATHFLAFIAPKVRKMGFGIEQQSEMISSFLGGVYKILLAEARARLEEHNDE